MMVYKKSSLRKPFWYSLLLLTIVILGSCRSNNRQRTDWDRTLLRGQVQLLEEWIYQGYPNYQRKNPSSHMVSWYSTSGFLEKIGYYSHKPEEMYWSTFYYKEDSIWIRNTLETNGGEGTPQTYLLYLLNEQGEQESILSFYLDSSLNYRADVTYNPQNLPTNVVYSQVTQPTKVPCRVEKTYDEQGRLKEERIYIHKGNSLECEELPNHSTFTYNEHNDVDREVLRLYNGVREVHSNRYLYDSIGNWTQRIHYRGDQVMDITERSFRYYPSS